MTANHLLASALVMDSGEPSDHAHLNLTFIKLSLNHPKTCHSHIVPHDNTYSHYKQNNGDKCISWISWVVMV